MQRIDLFKHSLDVLRALRYPTGLFAAAMCNSTGYHRIWIRDTVYAATAFEGLDDGVVISCYRALLDLLLTHEHKLDQALRESPKHSKDYLHPRYDHATLSELDGEWGNKQNDAVGLLLFKLSQLTRLNYRIVQDRSDIRVLQKLVYYLEAIDYWRDRDNGIWENEEEVHASSVGACVAGLKEARKVAFLLQDGSSYRLTVPAALIARGERTLAALLPRESPKKSIDLALLSLIWPFKLVDKAMACTIIERVEEMLVRTRGMIRYPGDDYYASKHGEAEWPMGFAWLAICHAQLGHEDTAVHYFRKAVEQLNERDELPELYLARSEEHNTNCPLAWGQAMLVVAGTQLGAFAAPYQPIQLYALYSPS